MGMRYLLVWLPTLAASAWLFHGLCSLESYRRAARENFKDHAGEYDIRRLEKAVKDQGGANGGGPSFDSFDFVWSPTSGFERQTDAARTNEFAKKVSAVLTRNPRRDRASYSSSDRLAKVRWFRVDQGKAPVYVGKVYSYDDAYEIRYILFNRLLYQVIVVLGLFFFSALASLVLYWLHLKNDFLAAVAHDLTTPLVALRGVIGHDDAEARLLNERMLRLVGNIKEFLHRGARRPPERERFDLMCAYREAYRVFAADYRDLFAGEDVPVESAEAAWPVEADELMTVQILWNLLGNDLKYAAPYGRVAVRVRSVRGPRGDARVRLELVDWGQGMSPRQMRCAFNRYYRAKTVLESGKGGFGIGLCTAREFARAMGGDLTVCANEPRGCVFALELPAAVPESGTKGGTG